MNVALILLVLLVLLVSAPASGDQYIAGIDIGKEYEARVRSGIEHNRKNAAEIEVISKGGKPVSGVSVKVTQTTSDFLFGCAFPQWTAPPQYLGKDGWDNWNRYFTRLFNYATTENSLKWGPLEPEEGIYKWESADFIANWCRQHNIKLKGHCLVWAFDHHGTPDWVYTHTPDEIGDLVKQRIDTVVGRYKDDIRIWDVVNESTHLHRFETAWRPDYQVLAFKWAREADPDATLVINEYSNLCGNADKYVTMVKRLLANGAPIDAIGEQAHDSPLWYSPKQIFSNLDKLASTGLRVHLTEVTHPSSGAPITGGFVNGNWDEQKQAEFYRYLMTLAFSHPNVDAITFWAFWDGSSWLQGGGIVRKDWTPKPAYYVVDDLINNKWKTRFETRSDANGKISFHGFHGQYEITATTADGKTARGDMRISRSKDIAKITIRMD